MASNKCTTKKSKTDSSKNVEDTDKGMKLSDAVQIKRQRTTVSKKK